MDYTEIKVIDKYLHKVLSPKRYEHSLGVVLMAEKLAKLNDVNIEKARFAALVHDIAKCNSCEIMNRLIREYGVDTKYINNPELAHSKVGTAILYYDFGIKDQEILDAVSSHTAGRYGMSTLEEVIYVADAIEPKTRVYKEAPKLRELAVKSLDKACLEIIGYSIELLTKRGIKIDQDTLDAQRYISEKIDKR